MKPKPKLRVVRSGELVWFGTGKPESLLSRAWSQVEACQGRWGHRQSEHKAARSRGVAIELTRQGDERHL